jgi:hypothetical protein
MASDLPAAVGVCRFRVAQSLAWLNNGSVCWLFAELNIAGGLPRFAANSKGRDRNNAATGTGEFSLVKDTSERSQDQTELLSIANPARLGKVPIGQPATGTADRTGVRALPERDEQMSRRWFSRTAAPAMILTAALLAMPSAAGAATATITPLPVPAAPGTGTVAPFPAVQPAEPGLDDIICDLNVQNPHKSTHVPTTVNDVATVSCNLPPAALGLTIALYYWTGKTWVLVGVGQATNYNQSYIQANASANCVSGTYEGAAEAEAVAPPGYVPPIAYGYGYSVPVYVTC